MEHKHKNRPRKSYNNVNSYDDELAIVLYLLSQTKKVEKEITKEFEKVFENLCKLYKEQFPFYYTNGVLNKREWERLFLSLSTRGVDTVISEAIAEMRRETEELQTRKLMSWLILDYMLTAQRTAQSIGVNPSQSSLLLSKQYITEAVKKPWCKDGKSFLNRIIDNSKDLEQKLRVVIVEGYRKGWSLEQMTAHFRRITGAAASKAARLIRTETMAVYSKATKDMFLENGIEYVEIIGDAACGGICLDYVGEALPLRDAQIGDDLPPYHPNCACSFCSYTEFDNEDRTDSFKESGIKINIT